MARYRCPECNSEYVELVQDDDDYDPIYECATCGERWDG